LPLLSPWPLEIRYRKTVAHLSIEEMERYALKELSEAGMLKVEKHVANRKRRSNMKTRLKSAGCTTGMFLSVVLLGGSCFAQPAVTLSATGGPPTIAAGIDCPGQDAAPCCWAFRHT
jgi:hypothetical protein